MSGFSDRLLDELTYYGYSQADLARHLGVRQSTVQTWIQRGSIPAADTALRIADFLNVSLEYLVTGKLPESKKPKIEISDFNKELMREADGLIPEDKTELLAYIRMKKSLYVTLRADNGKTAIVKDC